MDFRQNNNNNNGTNFHPRNRRPDSGQMRDFNSSGGNPRYSMDQRSRSRERDFNNRDSSNSGPARYNRRSRSRSRSRERMRRGYDDHRRDYGPDDDSRDTMRTNYSSSSSSYRNDRYRGRQDEHKSGGGGGGGFDRRDKGGYSRGYSPNNSYAHQNQNQGRDRNDCDEDYDSCESDSYTSQTPHNKIIVRGLAPHITEADIGSDLMQFNLKPVSIRLIRRRNTGASRGFAFVEFSTVDEATRWMDYKQGVLMVQDQYRAVMQYSSSRGPSTASGGYDRRGGSATNPDNITDWYCSKCLVFNFKRRENCFKCYASREESEKGGDGWDEISNVLTKKIILRNLDVLTNEEGVLTVMQEVLPLDQVAKISKILVCRDPLTNTSRGICYLSFDNLVDSMNVHNGLKGLEPPLTIDGRDVGISYCTEGTTAINQQESGGGSAEDGRHQQHVGGTGQSQSQFASEGNNVEPQASTGGGHNTFKYTQADVPRLSEYSAKLYATNAAEHEHYYKYYEQYYAGEIANGQFANMPTISQLGGETANSGAAVAQSAIQRKQQEQQQGRKGRNGGGSGRSHHHHHHHHQSDTGYGDNSHATPTSAPARMSIPNGKDGEKYPVPDVSQFQFEETSGYYYDSSTGLYYDANSQYYYNSELSCYLYWDGENRTYKLAPTGSATKVEKSADESLNNSSSVKDVDPAAAAAAEDRAPDKVKHAKKIVKDMEKWAKQLNQKKDMSGGPLQLPVPVKEEHPLRQGGPLSSNGACADVGFAILEKKDKLPLSIEPMGPIRSTPSTAGSKLVAYGSDSDNEGETAGGGPLNEKDYVDFEKLTCLLCKRAFQSQEILSKHTKMSDLHKQNLAKYKLANATKEEAANDAAGLSYRDRAKERRKKYGEVDAPLNKSRERFHKEMEKQASAAALVAASSSVAQTPIGGGNMGNKLLQKMGWQEGMGLGRSNQGRTNIIEVESRAGGAGLGTKTAGPPPFAGGDYKTYIKKMMKQRYEQL